MTMQEAGVIIWLTDLVASNPHQVRLSEKVHEQWDLAIAKDQTFGIMDCITIGLTHWSKMRERPPSVEGSPAPEDHQTVMTMLTQPCPPRKRREKGIKRKTRANPRME